MKKNNFNKKITSDLLREFFILCNTKKIDVFLTQNDGKLDIFFDGETPPGITINIPDPDDKKLPSLLKKWIKKLK